MTAYFIQAFIYLCAAVIMVPLANRLGLGSVLGYLIAGVIIGPVAGFVGTETATIQHFAEFGVVMMLFLVGLELEPKSLWSMRHRLLGLGGLQISLTTGIVSACALMGGLPWSVALAIGLIFSLSSTAIVLQTFAEKGLAKTEGGMTAFSVLLFQDIAVIPILAFMPLLALPELQAASAKLTVAASEHDALSLIQHSSGPAATAVIFAAIGSVVLCGYYLSRPLFRFVASSGLQEIFTATALMLVIGIAALMSMVGLSPALGTFLAGVVLANSEFRHELEANIQPFKGLLLGLFFITVGAGIHFDVLYRHLNTVIEATLALMLIKALVLTLLARIFQLSATDSKLFALSLAQAGEFGFVLLSYATSHDVIAPQLAEVLALVVALSMFLTPLLFIFFEKVIQPYYRNGSDTEQTTQIDKKSKVIIAGIGRFGQIVNRLLNANGMNTVVLDHSSQQIEMLRQVKIKSYYGDASRPDLLDTAGIQDADLLIVAIDDRSRAIDLVAYVKKHFPQVRILARAYDRGHEYELQLAGADSVIRETYHSALALGGEALTQLGHHPFHVEQMKHRFSELESSNHDTMYQSWLNEGEQKAFGAHYRDLFLQIEELLQQAMRSDRSDAHSLTERAWTPPPKGYLTEIE